MWVFVDFEEALYYVSLSFMLEMFSKISLAAKFLLYFLVKLDHDFKSYVIRQVAQFLSNFPQSSDSFVQRIVCRCFSYSGDHDVIQFRLSKKKSPLKIKVLVSVKKN